jgi:hypothetical protein
MFNRGFINSARAPHTMCVFFFKIKRTLTRLDARSHDPTHRDALRTTRARDGKKSTHRSRAVSHRTATSARVTHASIASSRRGVRDAAVRIMEPQYAPLVVVGSGRGAIAVLARLPEAKRAQAVVIDPSGAWLHAFSRRCLRSGASHVRCAVTQHPFASACGLERFVEDFGRQDEIVRTSEAYAPVPSVKVYAEYCARMVAEHMRGVRLVKGVVADVQMIDEDAIGQFQCADPLVRYGAVLLTLDSGERVLAAQCVWTPKHSQPRAPSWIIDAKASYRLAHPSYDGHSGVACGIMTSNDVDVSVEGRVLDKTILVVGGGMSAATLALEATRRGAKSVTLLSRRLLDVREFECDVQYFGCKGLRKFHACADAQRKAEMLDSYKAKASVNEHTYLRLIDESSSERNVLSIIEQHNVLGAEWDASKHRWFTRIAPTDEATMEFETRMYERLRDTGAPPDSVEEFKQEKGAMYDEIWIACGEVVDITHDGALRTLIATTSVEIACGLPALADETFDYEHGPSGVAPAGGNGGCRWPNTSLFVTGAYAALTIGPGSDYPVGHRMAAKNIVDALKKYQTMTLTKKGNPYRAASKPAHADDVDDVVRGPVTPDTSPDKQILKRLPIEHARHALIDASSVVPSRFERVELNNFQSCEEDMTMELRILTPESISAKNLHVVFDTHAFEMWAIGESRAYRFFVAKLYKEIIVERCSFRAVPKKNRVVIILHKRNNLYWRFLRG